MASVLEFIKKARQFGLSLRLFSVLVVLNLLASVFEVLGLGMFLPIFQFLNANGSVDGLAGSSRYWKWIVYSGDLIGLKVNLAFLLGVGFFCIVARQLFTYVRTLVEVRARFGCRYRAVYSILRSYFAVRLAYHDDMMIGQLTNNITIEVPRAIDGLFRVVSLVSHILLIAVYLVFLFLFASWITLVALLVVAVSVLVGRGAIRESRRAGIALTASNARLSTFLTERLSSLRLVRLSGAEAEELKSLDRMALVQRDNSVRLQMLSVWLRTISELSAILIAIVFLYAGYTYFNASVAVLSIFFIALLRLLPVIQTAVGLYQQAIEHLASFEAVDRLFAAMRGVREPKGGKIPFKGVGDAIRVENVSYAYQADVPALVDVTCEIPAQKMTAIVGPSGSGKSTFIDLLPRLRDPDGGVITVDGVNLSDFVVTSLRNGIAFVPQEPLLFNVTVAEHIAYGRGDANESDIRNAARLACVDDFIAQLPEGYSTMLGDGGERLSGGQRQRIDLARALFRRAPILILDEPTSQLDVESEFAFREAMQRVRRETKTTIIIVGHRLGTVIDADRILVFQDGVVAESGTHRELLQLDGWYAKAHSRHFDGDLYPQPSAATV